MAKDMIEKIREAEAAADRIICEAGERSKETVKQAEQKAGEFIKLSAAKADADAAKIVKEAEAEAENVKSAAGRRGWAEGEKLSAKADKNRAAALSAAKEIIFS